MSDVTTPVSEVRALEVRTDEADAALAQEVQNEMAPSDTGTELAAGTDAVASEAEVDQLWKMYDAVDVQQSDQLRGAWGALAGENLGLIFEFAESEEGVALIEALPEHMRDDPGWLPVGLTLARRWKSNQDSPATPTKRTEAMPEGTRQEGLQVELDKLTSQQYIATAHGDHAKATALDADIMRVAARISGDGPIVGSGGRTSEL